VIWVIVTGLPGPQVEKCNNYIYTIWAIICLMPLYASCHYMPQAIICLKSLYASSHYMPQAIICLKSLYASKGKIQLRWNLSKQNSK
jgi:hypothetical protein